MTVAINGVVQIGTANLEDDSVTSAKIDDDTILDADVNSAAAISGSKLQAAAAGNAGAIELATQAEVDTGTDTTRAVTPDTLDGLALSGDLGGTLGAPTVAHPSETDFVNAYDTTTQAISVADTLQDVTFDTNVKIDGWTHTGGSADFTCATTGKYRATFIAMSDKTAGANSLAEIVALFNGAQLAGSAVGRTIDANNSIAVFSNTFIFDGVATQILKLQFTGDTTNTRLTPGTAIATVNPSIILTITRLS